MKELVVFEFLVFFTIAQCELLIAVPQSTQAEQQKFDAIFIKTPNKVGSETQEAYLIQTPATTSIRETRGSTFQLTPTQIPQTPGAESKSFGLLDAVQNQLGIDRVDPNGVTITIRVNPKDGGLQIGQGSKSIPSFASRAPPLTRNNPPPSLYGMTIPPPSHYGMTNPPPSRYGMTNPLFNRNVASASEQTYSLAEILGFSQPQPPQNNFMQQTHSLADVLKSGLIIARPSQIQPAATQNIVGDSDVSMFESNGFLKSLTNLVRSQMSTIMGRSKSPASNPFEPQGLYSQQYAIFAPISVVTPKPQTTTPIVSNLANFLSQKLTPQPATVTTIQPIVQPSKPMPQVFIAQPNSNAVQESATVQTTENNDESSPLYSAASAIANTVSQIPSNLDMMFNDMGRVYRKNLFNLRDTISDMSVYLPYVGGSKAKENKEPWLDAYGV